MIEPSVNRDVPIINVPLNEKGDYDKDQINYSSNFNWTTDDKRVIEATINKFYNSYDSSGDEVVGTSFGEVLVTHKIHPVANRRKLIQGFLLNEYSKVSKISSNSLEEQDIFSIIRRTAPDFISSNKYATEFLDKLIEQIRLYGISSDEFKLEVFSSILSSLESVASRHISDQPSKERLSHLVEVVKTYLPKDCNGKQE